jgi:hypothetical protein
MKLSSRYRVALVACALAGILSDCSGASVAPSSSLSNAISAVPKMTGRSWADPTAKDRDLVYVSAQSAVDVYTYPGGNLVGSLSGAFVDATGLCSDAQGNVWVVSPSLFGTSTLVEYAHGGDSPIATLQDGDKNVPQDCSVDPVSGNLAVANMNANVAIYANAEGSPTYYSTQGLLENVRTVSYDGSGDLYMRSFTKEKAAAWLAKGGSTVARFLVKRPGYYYWDGSDLAIDSGGVRRTTLARYKLDGAGGTKVQSLPLKTCQKGGVFAIEGSELAIICGAGVTYYSYPLGGDPIKTLPVDSAGGIAISIMRKKR